MAITLGNRTITILATAAVTAALLTAAGLGTTGVEAGPGPGPGDVRGAAPVSGVFPTNQPRPTTRALPVSAAPVSGAAAVTIRQQLAVARYWTPARMRAAIRHARPEAWSGGDSLGQGLRWVRDGAVARTTGKVFFTLDAVDYVCSGSVVDSAGQDVVLTAAHCTGNGADDWAANWMFVPGYADGSRPYGTYTARRFYVSPQWSGLDGATSASAEKYDVAFVAVNPSVPADGGVAGGPGGARGASDHGASAQGNGAGRRLEEVTGGLPVAFGGTLNGQGTHVFGYPSDPPFTGLYPDYCAGRARQTARDAANGIASVTCGMTAGDSGGPWLAAFSPRTGSGTIVAISTYKYSDSAGTLYGTVLGRAAESLYEAASRGR